MSKPYGSYRAGAAFASSACLRMEASYLREHDLSENRDGWQKHFDQYVFSHYGIDIARPCMYKGHPYWIADVYECLDETIGNERMVISDFKERHIIVPMSRIIEPTDKEYIKHFKSYVENGKYKLSFKEKIKKTYVQKVPKKGKKK